MAIDDSKNPLKDGPFGYIDKGTFFEDAPLNGQFPESIEVIYQVRNLRTHQVWLLTQFYSVDFSQARIGINKCVLNKRTIKVCVSCC